jgi:hypothetical protein
MCLELLKDPNLLNAHSKYGRSCSIYIMKADCVALGVYLRKKKQLAPYFECAFSSFRDILNAHRATLGASLKSLEKRTNAPMRQ